MHAICTRVVYIDDFKSILKFYIVSLHGGFNR